MGAGGGGGWWVSGGDRLVSMETGEVMEKARD